MGLNVGEFEWGMDVVAVSRILYYNDVTCKDIRVGDLKILYLMFIVIFSFSVCIWSFFFFFFLFGGVSNSKAKNLPKKMNGQNFSLVYLKKLYKQINKNEKWIKNYPYFRNVLELRVWDVPRVKYPVTMFLSLHLSSIWFFQYSCEIS